MNWKEINKDAQALIDALGFDIDATDRVRDLSIVQNMKWNKCISKVSIL